jgi:hypothetical protein
MKQWLDSNAKLESATIKASEHKVQAQKAVGDVVSLQASLPTFHVICFDYPGANGKTKSSSFGGHPASAHGDVGGRDVGGTCLLD